MKNRLKKIAIALGLSKELTAEEKLVNLTKEQKQENLIADILRIRRIGGYEPNYNKPPVFTDYPIQLKVITACERPIDFGNNIVDWVKSVQEDHIKKLTKEKVEKESYEKSLEERKEAVHKVMRHFTNVY